MRRAASLIALAALAACGEAPVEPESADVGPAFAVAEGGMDARMVPATGAYALHSASYITTPDSDEMGRTIFFNDRGNKRTGSHFVEGDPRREWNGTNAITWGIDGTQGVSASGLSQDDTNGAIRSAMETWQGVRCSTMPLIDVGEAPFDYGYVQYLFGLGGAPLVAADLVHAGFLPGAFFDLLAPGGSNFILGVTFTLSWVDGDGNFTDVDNNGQTDTALREIYYNDAFGWNTGSTYDVETVALHEAGHGLSQAHFGSAFTNASGQLFFSPRAVMNAAYSGVQTSITQTDNAGHCANWGAWGNVSMK